MSLRKAVGLLTGFALAIGLIGAGVSASFTDSVTAQENINVGTFSCGITTASTGAILGARDALNYAHSVTYTAATIEGSDLGRAEFSFTVKNTGSIPDVLTVATSAVTTPPWSIIGAPFAPVALASGASNVYNTGVSWTELGTGDLGAHFTVTWTVSCNEVATKPAFSVGYYTTTGNGDPGTSTGFSRYATPQASVNLGDGTASQVLNPDGSVTLSLSAATGYADTGFYEPLGMLSSLTGYNITSSGSAIGTNLYLDTNSNGFFLWDGAGHMTSTDGDVYASAPSGTGIVIGSTPFYVMTGTHAGNTLTLDQLKADYPGTTPVAVWVGITSSGAALSTTITSAP